MGSLSSSPRVRTGTQVVYTPPTTINSTSASSEVVMPDTQVSLADASESAAESARVNRNKVLLLRNRGTLGTILTGFRGVLGVRQPSQNAAQGKKTLLGQ